jgi:hypothetical protein
MNYVVESIKRFAAKHGRERSEFRNQATAQPAPRHRTAIDTFRPPIIKRFYPDWFALRIWEDDGGGQLS